MLYPHSLPSSFSQLILPRVALQAYGDYIFLHFDAEKQGQVFHTHKHTVNAAAYAFAINYTREHDARLRKHMHIFRLRSHVKHKHIKKMYTNKMQEQTSK